jgi:hypothetical protein
MLLFVALVLFRVVQLTVEEFLKLVSSTVFKIFGYEV